MGAGGTFRDAVNANARIRSAYAYWGNPENRTQLYSPTPTLPSPADWKRICPPSIFAAEYAEFQPQETPMDKQFAGSLRTLEVAKPPVLDQPKSILAPPSGAKPTLDTSAGSSVQSKGKQREQVRPSRPRSKPRAVTSAPYVEVSDEMDEAPVAPSSTKVQPPVGRKRKPQDEEEEVGPQKKKSGGVKPERHYPQLPPADPVDTAVTIFQKVEDIAPGGSCERCKAKKYTCWVGYAREPKPVQAGSKPTKIACHACREHRDACKWSLEFSPVVGERIPARRGDSNAVASTSAVTLPRPVSPQQRASNKRKTTPTVKAAAAVKTQAPRTKRPSGKPRATTEPKQSTSLPVAIPGGDIGPPSWPPLTVQRDEEDLKTSTPAAEVTPEVARPAMASLAALKRPQTVRLASTPIPEDLRVPKLNGGERPRK